MPRSALIVIALVILAGGGYYAFQQQEKLPEEKADALPRTLPNTSGPVGEKGSIRVISDASAYTPKEVRMPPSAERSPVQHLAVAFSEMDSNGDVGVSLEELEQYQKQAKYYVSKGLTYDNYPVIPEDIYTPLSELLEESRIMDKGALVRLVLEGKLQEGIAAERTKLEQKK
jgi:hypothetical protein